MTIDLPKVKTFGCGRAQIHTWPAYSVPLLVPSVQACASVVHYPVLVPGIHGRHLAPYWQVSSCLFLRSVFFFLFIKSLAYGMDSRPPMAIFELLDYIVNEVSTAWLP